ncbi:glycosyltransferase [Deinococcus planocerae]|uniref:glycosyltransferase n=1 Tax=Deinococcus planocerae TaxID=1737569 RepID=UPI000C7ECBFE|nr:nucleotide disphospho-sugar-binding domain-containing protein [Deinococcus planocerae]
MSNILIATLPLAGHVNPLLPLARELVTRGHGVLWYTGRHFETAVRATGADYAPFASAPDHGDTPLDDVFPRRRGRSGLRAIDFDMRHVFADPIPAYVRDLTALNRRFHAGTLVTDAGFLAGAALRRLLYLKWVAVGVMPLLATSVDTAPFGPGIAPRSDALGRLRNRALSALLQRGLLAGANAHTARVFETLGLGRPARFMMDLPFHEADVYLHGSVPTFEYPRRDLPGSVKFVGPLLPDPATTFVRPAWWDELRGGRPVVHVTQGTLDLDFEKLLRPTLQALEREDVLVVATTGGRPVSDVRGPLPANVRLEPFIPHDVLLPFVDVMVTNGGFGGVQRALAEGVPLVVAGDTEDKPEVGRRVSWSGVGIDLRSGRPRPGRIRDAVRAVLRTPSFRARAQHLQQEYRAVSGPRLAADYIDALLGARTI